MKAISKATVILYLVENTHNGLYDELSISRIDDIATAIYDIYWHKQREYEKAKLQLVVLLCDRLGITVPKMGKRSKSADPKFNAVMGNAGVFAKLYSDDPEIDSALKAVYAKKWPTLLDVVEQHFQPPKKP